MIPTCRIAGLAWKAAGKVSGLGAGLLVTLVILMVSGRSALAWGPEGHRLVNNWAVETLPSEISGFFEANRQFLVEHANDPDEWIQKDRYERKRHYLYFDKYGLFPYLALPHRFNAAVEKFGSGRVNRDGLLPWHVGEYSLRLTNALREQKWEEAKLAAAALGHYVADAHDPLHTTSNYDGQLSSQTGLSTRFGQTLIERYKNFMIMRSALAVKIDDPTEFAFSMALEANTWVDNVLLADRRALVEARDYNEEYFDRLYGSAGPIAAQELNAAARDLGSYWYTAWLNAGRPALPGR